MKKIIAILLLLSVFPHINANKTVVNDSTLYYVDSTDYNDDYTPTVTITKKVILPSDLTGQQENELLEVLEKYASVKYEDGMLVEASSATIERSEMKPMTPKMQNEIAIQSQKDRPAIYDWRIEESVSPLPAVRDVIVLCNTVYVYFGGAHGMSMTKYINYSLKEHHELTLSDFINTNDANVTKAVRKTLTNVFNKQYHAEWGDLREFRNDDLIPLSDNFYLTDKGITFVYQEYEIGPYALGQPILEISYQTLKQLNNF